MQALILAAGMGKRLKELTKDNTKCMIEVNGITLIDRMLHQLERYGLSRIVIVVGYKGNKLKDYIATLNITTPIEFVENPIYNKTNNIYSLSLAKEYLCKEDTLLFESDLIFEDEIIKSLIEDNRSTLAVVDKYESWMDGTCVKLDENDSIEAFIPGKSFKFNEIKDYYKTVNIYKFSKEFSVNCYVPFLDAYSKALGNNEYYEQVLRVITMLDNPEIKAKRLNGQLWYEIDDIQDLDIATSMFAEDLNEKVNLLQNRYGGYWRYPQLIDFCYLVNPYYPPQKLLDEIKASMEKLITQYPSGMNVNALLASKNFNIRQENIVVGNGAAELIKALVERFNGNVGFIKPTFEEYPNRYDDEKSVIFYADKEGYRYDVGEIIGFFDNKQIEALILVNPDNPTGNYIPKTDLFKLIDWSKNKQIKLIVDESFVDFAEEDGSLIHQEIIDKNENLYLIKSISKSYGVPGLRLGILVSGNSNVIKQIKQDVSIWNINSIAEFYMQIEEKYKKFYEESLIKIKAERVRFINELNKIKGITVMPSQANYLMCKLNKMDSTELTKKLLINHNLFIKDLAKKLGGKNYIRIAVRNTEDNNKLLNALHLEMEK